MKELRLVRRAVHEERRAVRSSFALLIVGFATAFFLALACGVDSTEYEAVQAELKELKEENRELQAELAKLRETDQAYWEKALEYRDKGEWNLAATTLVDLISRWPDSSLQDKAQELLQLSQERIAELKYEEAMKAIIQQDETRARALLEAVLSEYPTTEHGRQARSDLQSLSARMSRAAQEQEQADKRARERRSRAASVLELTAFSWHRESSYAVAEGMVKNISSTRFEDVEAVAIFTDSGGSFITSDSALIDYRPLLPGQASPFKVYARWNPSMSKCRVEFKSFGGPQLRTHHSWR